MRVLEAGSTPAYKMGKNRKHRIRKNRENEAEESSDDGAAICTHIPKAVNFAAMRKALLKQTCVFGECSTCAAEVAKSGAKDLFGSPLEGAAASAAEDSEFEPTIWVCLQCGHQGCDRNSRERHALKHFETPHSGIHCVVANLTTWSAWCYTCDNDIPVDASKRVQECIDFLRKQAGLPRLELGQFAGQRGLLPASQLDSPTDPSPPTSQSRGDKAQVAGKTTVVSCQKVKGLNNLGNTCFFNAVMQNLCQTHSLESLLVTCCKKGRPVAVGGWREGHSDSDSSMEGEEEEDGKSKELAPIEIVAGDAGPLSSSLLNFVQEMNNGSSHATVSPNSLFSHVCKKAPRFKGFQQQDSHELLRYLVDVVRNEEIKRAQSGILKFFKLSETVNPKKVDEDTKSKIKEYGRQVKFTFLDSLFGGQLVSTVTCEECKHISQIFEPFLDLSLPVTEEKPQRPNQMQGGRRKDSLQAAGGAGDAHEETAPSIGVDGFAERADKPSKYQERKNRQAKKEARKKSRRTGGGRKGKGGGQARGKSAEGKEDEEGGGEGGAKGESEAQQGSANSLDMEEENSSAQEDPSDADVEDNLDNETTRQQVNYDGYGNNISMNSDPHQPHNHLEQQTPSNSTLNHCGGSNQGPSHDGLADGVKEENFSLSIKGDGMTNKLVLPSDQSLTNSQAASSQSSGLGCGKDLEKQEMDKSVDGLANGISSLELEQGNKTDLDRTRSQGQCVKPGVADLNNVDHHEVKGAVSVVKEGRSSPIAPHPVANHCHDACDEMAGGDRAPAEEGHQHLTSGRADVMATTSTGGESAARVAMGETTEGADNMEDAGDGTGAASLAKDLEGRLVLTEGAGVSAVGVGGSIGGGGSGGGPSHKGDKKGVANQALVKSMREVHREARYKSKTTLAPRYHPVSKECTVMSCLHQFTAAELLTGSNKVCCKVCTKLRPKNASMHKDKKGSDNVYSNASKQFLVFVPPAVLTLHLKRFEQVGFTSRKVNRHVEFPLVLDIAPYCSSLCRGVRAGQRRVLYSLYGVVEHSGRLQGGHYTAYVKVRPSLGPLTSFLHSSPPNPMEYIYRYMEQVQNGPSSFEETGEEETAELLSPPGRWFHVSDSRINDVTEATVLKAQAYLLFYERIY